MTTQISFNNSIENIDYSKNYSYLLNFWHTTKLNKELEFIKRNGLHPAITIVDKRGVTDISVDKGNEISTNFYTVFRIFFENLFEKQVSTAKEREREEWRITFNDDIQGLNSKPYLLMHYAKSENIASEVIEYVQHYRTETCNPSPFKIRLRNKDQLHSKKLLETLENYEVHAKQNIDQGITTQANMLMDKISHYLDFPKVAKKSVKVKGLGPNIVLVQEPEVPVVPRGTLNAGLDALLPVYRQLNPSIIGMESRVRFSFILNYAQQGTNVIINRIENNETNYREFMRLTNNMTA